MKILQVTNFFKPSWEAGGTARSVYEISNNLTKKGHDVTVYTTDGFKYRLDVTKNKPVFVDGIRTYYFRNLSNYLSKKMVIPVPYYLPLIAKEEIKEFDIIHIHEHRTVLAAVVYHYAKKYNIPYIVQPRGSVPLNAKGRQKKVFDIIFGKAIINDAIKVIASSKIESDQYQSVFPELNEDKIVHIPNGIDLEMYLNLPKKGIFRKKYLIKSNEKIILYLSRIHKRKGADILIEAFNLLKGNYCNVKLVIAGSDEGFLTELKAIVKKYKLKNDVIFTGSLNGKDKLEAYVDADVFVLASIDKYESFGNVILEACACGTPVIFTNNCGISEWIKDDVGFIVECDKNQIADSISKLLSDDVLWNKFSINAQKLTRKYSWQDITEELSELYESCL